ncbi:MAG: TolC family protein [Candidatus Marinimicrobia bacterium]|nr:TolC family protein [Candidatus Neomarinimicrobiota bacterium]
MLNKKILILVNAILLLSLSISLYAETLDLDLKTARKITLENNPGIKLAREEVNKSSQRIIESRAGLLPTVSAFSSLQHAWELPTMILNLPPAMGGQQKFKMGTENNIVSGINIYQPLFTSGVIWNGYQISKIGYNIAQSQLKSAEQNILTNLTSAYYGVLFSKSAIIVSEEALQSSEENLAQVQNFYNAGKSSQFDILRAEVQVANMKPIVVSAKNNFRLAESRLRMIMGIGESTELNFTEEMELKYSDLTEKTLAELIKIATSTRPEMMIMNNQKQIANRQLSMSKAAFMPSIVFGTAYQYQGQRDDFKFVGDDFFKSFNSSVSINIPLFNGFKNSAKLQQAKIAIKESDHQAESLTNGIKLEVKGAFFTMKEAQEKVQTQQKTIEQAKEAQRLARLMYSEGASTQLDVLNANLALNQARMNYQQSLFEYNVALANLKKSINQL